MAKVGSGKVVAKKAVQGKTKTTGVRTRAPKKRESLVTEPVPPALAKERQQKRMMQPAGCRTYVRRRLAKEFPEIVDGFVKEAKKGGCNHIKQAMELLKPTRKGTPRRKGPGQKLLEDLCRE